MSFGFSVATWAAIGSAVMSAAQLEQQRKASSQANTLARNNAERQARMADEAANKANAKSPDTMAALQGAMLAGRQGNSSTMLTGPGGVDPSTLLLGRSSLLGGG